MEDFEAEYRQAVQAGQRNIRAKKLLENWCYHAEFARTGGVGMIEANTGLPIGHMGVRCKFSKKNSMFSWLLEDAVYDFYLSNCKGCDKRVPVGLPNIAEFIEPRERKALQRKAQQQAERDKQDHAKKARKQTRAALRSELSFEETHVLDLIDELDDENITHDDPRLEQFANLAPEVFGQKIITYLLPAAIHENFPYSLHAAKALIKAPLEPTDKLAVAVRLLESYVRSSEATSYVLAESDKLNSKQLSSIISRFVSMAVTPPPSSRIGAERREYDDGPIRQLFENRKDDLVNEIDALFGASQTGQIAAAVRIILALSSDELFRKNARNIFGKLMRRRRLLQSEGRNSEVLFYLREAASECFRRSPNEADSIIQSFLKDNDDTGKQEAIRVYRTAFRHSYRENPQIGEPQKIAFRRLLWAAVDEAETTMNEAGQFFRHAQDEYAALAVEHLDELIGAAATLSQRYDSIGTSNQLESSGNWLAQMERQNSRSAIDNLQGALIKWAAIGARFKGKDGVDDFLTLYRHLPESQTQMRGNMMVHVSELLSGVDSLNAVLSDWYRALMDESALVRASAVQAWEGIPLGLRDNFPDLFFQAISVLLTDPYVIVHKSAVRALARRSFPAEKRQLLSSPMWNLIAYYSQAGQDKGFLVECIRLFAKLCLTDDQLKGNFGVFLTNLLLTLDDDALYKAVDDLVFSFQDVPGFTKVALKALSSDYTRSISTEDCVTAIVRAPIKDVRECGDEIEKAFDVLNPFRINEFSEALLLLSALTKANRFQAAHARAVKMVEAIPEEDRNAQWRIEASLLETATAIETALAEDKPVEELVNRWKILIAELEKENAERAEYPHVPPRFLFEN
ncbi:hypothetical protein SAMN03159496_01016 [Rhizobium sp. NFR07]|uniref:hypothetical protein n=1 Tax=Rhizobium sp. NFR07 TaxID=1566262 RepID=UPI0008EFA5FB|nr:hypothetical protein [Rhizobium sp. NFR07]SFA93450.1 hypothetical protein SAMN03159496_01016 [Rhizobium sp. NFR07]